VADRWNLELDVAGIGRYLRSRELAGPIEALAQRVAGNADKHSSVEVGVSDRVRALVIISRRGRAADALGGKLITAATAAGLEVRARR